MRTLLMVLSITILVGFSASSAQAGGGDVGYNLSVPATVAIGTDITIHLQTSFKSIAILMMSDGPGPTNTPIGTFSLDFPLLSAVPIAMFPIEEAVVSCLVPCDSGLVGTVGYIQFMAIRLNGSSLGISNGASVTVTSSSCTP